MVDISSERRTTYFFRFSNIGQRENHDNNTKNSSMNLKIGAQIGLDSIYVRQVCKEPLARTFFSIDVGVEFGDLELTGRPFSKLSRTEKFNDNME